MIFYFSSTGNSKHVADTIRIEGERVVRMDLALKDNKLAYDNIYRKTNNLKVTDACVGCGLCAKKCPVEAIEMRDGKPVWTKDKCAMCLGCLHRCPRFAIEYGKNTRKHGQYVHTDVSIKDL